MAEPEGQTRPILMVPYTWIGDFVRGHSAIRLLNARHAGTAVDVVTSSLCAPLVDYMAGVRKGIVCDLPHGELAWSARRALGARLRQEGYGQAIVASRSWKAALAPFFAGIPVRTGFFGEGRLGVITDLRFGEKKLPRMIDRIAALTLPKGIPLPAELPLPELKVPAAEIDAFLADRGLAGDRMRVSFAPGSHASPAKRWPLERYAGLAKALSAQGIAVWVLGGKAETPLALEIVAATAGGRAMGRDLTGGDLRLAVRALAASQAAVSNDSGLLHLAAAIGTPAIGIFGATSPALWAPLNPIAATVQAPGEIPCRPCHKPTCRFGHYHCLTGISVEQVLATVHGALAESGIAATP